MTKRLSFFIPLAATMPLWVGPIAQPPSVAVASEGPASMARAARCPDLRQGFALAEPDGNEPADDDKLCCPGTMEEVAGLAEAPAEPSPHPAEAAALAPIVVRPVVAAARRTPPAPMRQVRRTSQSPRKIRMLVTAYCPCRDCCGRWTAGHRTACGRSVRANHSRFVAADTDVLPFGWRVSVPGYHGGAPVPVLDRGSAIVGRRLDVFFLSHAEAKRWGPRWLEVTVYRG